MRSVALPAIVASIAACVEEPPANRIELRYDQEYPEVRYAQSEPSSALAEFARAVNNRELRLNFHSDRGWLDATLEALGIDAASQVLVFSKTSLQIEGVTPQTPRAIYFNDEIYAAWVPGQQSIELASLDRDLGPVFYTLSQTRRPAVERRYGVCLSCHDSMTLTGGGVPRLITGSGYVDKRGRIVGHEGWIVTSDRTPLRSRWGGWYVTGMHGEQTHLGNIAVDNIYDLEDLESLRNGNHADLSEQIDASPYMSNKSDIVALLVLDHQTTVQNAIVRLSWDVRQQLDADIEPVVRALVMSGTAQFTQPISGTAGFENVFTGGALRDTAGRSLRDLDLQTRLFRYPLSFVINSPAFSALPNEVRRAVLLRIRDELTGEASTLADLPGDAQSRSAAWEILLATQPDLASLIVEQ